VPFGASKKEELAEARKRGHQNFLGEISGTTIVNDLRDRNKKRRRGEIRKIGGKTYGLENMPL